MNTSQQKSVFIKTFGCQMNEHDSEEMLSLLATKGYGVAQEMSDADLILVNTCSIREKSHQKALSELGRFAKGRKGAVTIGVTGCVATQEKEWLAKRFPYVNLVLGTDHISKLPDLVGQLESGEKIVQADLISEEEYSFPQADVYSSSKSKAYVTIMKGCDNVCTFCIVPSTRGLEISKNPDEIVREVQAYSEKGIKEVTLLGQNVNSYGRKLNFGTSFSQLIRRIANETDIARIRFTSPHPKDLSDDLIAEYGSNEKLCRHMHLPIQSGSNSVLKKMKRAYTREVYLRKVEKLRQSSPGIQFSTDIIVGFPGETEADFEDTLSLVREVGFQSCYSFVYSPRPGTEAFSMEDTLTRTEKEKRLFTLQSLQEEMGIKMNRSLIGQTLEVMVEGESKKGKKGDLRQFAGRSSGNFIVNFSGDKVQVGDILSVKVTEAFSYSLMGELDGTKG